MGADLDLLSGARTAPAWSVGRWTLPLARAAPPETGDDSGSPDALEPLPVNRARIIEEGSAPDGAATVEPELAGRASEAVFGAPPAGPKDQDDVPNGDAYDVDGIAVASGGVVAWRVEQAGAAFGRTGGARGLGWP